MSTAVLSLSGIPWAAAGVRISTTLLHEMKRRDLRYTLATMCVGVGQELPSSMKRFDGGAFGAIGSEVAESR